MDKHLGNPIDRLKQSLLERVRSLFTSNRTDNLKGFLARAVAGTLGFRVLNAGLGYAIGLLLARLLGAEGYGIYAYALAWATLIEMPATLGLAPLVTREISVYQTQSAWQLVRGLLRWSHQMIAIAAIALAAIAAILAQIVQSDAHSPTVAVFWIAMSAVPFMALSRLRQATMQAFDRIVVGQLPELLLRPIAIVLCLAGAYFFLEQKLTPPLAMGIYAAGTLIAFLVGVGLLLTALPPQIQTISSEYRTRNWIKNALPMLFLGGMYLLNNQTDTVMLGAMENAETVGIYTVANRGAGLITFILVAFNSALAPTFANLHAAGDRVRLQRVLTKSCRFILLAALPIALGLIVFGHWFLWLFGAEFVRGKLILIILCLGQLTNAFTGSVAVLLNMTGHQKDTAIGVAIAAILNIILNAALIPQWGGEGAATATATSTMIWNIALVILVYKRLKLYSTPLGKLS